MEISQSMKVTFQGAAFVSIALGLLYLGRLSERFDDYGEAIARHEIAITELQAIKTTLEQMKVTSERSVTEMRLANEKLSNIKVALAERGIVIRQGD